MKSFSIAIKVFIFTIFTSFIFVKLVFALNKPITIQSLESKNVKGGPVINKIGWFKYPDKDVWMMNQSHDSGNNFDRVAIIVDKNATPKTALFMQIEPGPLVWSEDLINKQVPFKVSCFMCHANGLRAIRPDWNGLVKPSLLEKAKVNLANLKIRSYGRVVEHPIHAIKDKSLDVVFKGHAEIDNETLKVKACVQCHNEEKQGVLTRQNSMTISFLVESGLMPPKGNELAAKDRQKIKNFLAGF